MCFRSIGRLAACCGLIAVAACASAINPSASDVQIRTNPDRAHCEMTGGEGYRAEIDTPAVVTIPHSAAPVQVACTAPGRRRTVNTLSATSSGWIWGNTALLMVTGGAAVLGLVVDDALGSNWTYPSDAIFDLDAERQRSVQVKARDGSQTLDLKAR